MSGGGQPAPDLPCRAARPVGGTSDQSTPEIAMAATTGKKNPHDRPAHHHQCHQVLAGSGVTLLPRWGLRGQSPRFQLAPIHPK